MHLTVIAHTETVIGVMRDLVYCAIVHELTLLAVLIDIVEDEKVHIPHRHQEADNSEYDVHVHVRLGILVRLIRVQHVTLLAHHCAVVCDRQSIHCHRYQDIAADLHERVRQEYLQLSEIS